MSIARNNYDVLVGAMDPRCFPVRRSLSAWGSLETRRFEAKRAHSGGEAEIKKQPLWDKMAHVKLGPTNAGLGHLGQNRPSSFHAV